MDTEILNQMPGHMNKTLFAEATGSEFMEHQDITHGLWSATAPAGPKLSPFHGDQKTDIAVIGGGYTGLSAALHLAKTGKESVLLEAKEVGHGGAGRNVGLVNAGLWLMPEDVIKLVGPAYGEKLIKQLGASPKFVFDLIKSYNIECEALQNGTLHCADSKNGYKTLKQRETQWLKLDAPVRLLDQDETESWTGSTVFRGALLDDRAGTLQPLAYARGLAQAAIKEGAQLYDQSPVIGFEKNGENWILKTPGGTLKARAVIIAVHGYAENAFKDSQKNMVPFNFFQFATKPLPENIREKILPDRRGAWDTNLILSSYRRDAAGRLIVGSVGMAEGFSRNLHGKWVKRTISRTFPQIKDLNLEYGWQGRIAMTPDHIPRFHLPDKNVAMVTCYNGRGIGPGTLFGKLLAQYIISGSPDEIPLPVSAVDPVRFRMLRGLFYETGARLYHFAQRRI